MTQTSSLRELLRRIRGAVSDESGASAIEYALIAGLIAVALISALGLVGTSVSGMFSTVASEVGEASPSE